MNPTTSKRRLLIGSLIVIILIAAGFALRSHFQHAHSHGNAHDHGTSVLALNDGQRWETDEPLRLGMQRIRDAVALQLHEENATPAQTKALAVTVQETVTYLMQNCQLAPAADANLHVIINDLMAGASLLTTDGQSNEGLARLRHALDAYPRYFNHPNWSPLPDPHS